MILVGDIGGTKTILALYIYQQGDWVCKKKEMFASVDFPNFNEILKSFVDKNTERHIKKVCIGVAGPIMKGDCNTTNLPWTLKTQEIIKQTGADKVCLLNDLEATAWGVLALPESDFVELNSKAVKAQGNIAILAAGTGLGESLAIKSDEQYHIVATEGGHTDFAPRNELEIGLLRYLMTLFPEHVSYERVVCGVGLKNIYDYLKSIQYATVNKEMELRMCKQDPGSVIGEMGMGKRDDISVKALEMFCELYGAEAGNLALKTLSRGGVVLAGGIAGKILPCMQSGAFIRGFLAKGRYQALLQDISVRVCMNAEVGLFGTLRYAEKML